jgi:hypothetical protein
VSPRRSTALWISLAIMSHEIRLRFAHDPGS